MSCRAATYLSSVPAFAAALALACGIAYAERIPASQQTLPAALSAEIAPVRSALLFDLEASEPSLEETAKKTSAVLGALLSARADLHVIDPDSFGEAIDTVPENARHAYLAHITGASMILSGRVFASSRDLFIVVRVSGAETGKSFGEVVKVLPFEQPTVAVEQLAGRVAALIEARQDDLLASEPLPHEIRETLSKVSDSLALRITHLSDAEDPEAELFRAVLRDSGFEIVDGRHAGPALDLDTRISVSDGPRKDGLFSAAAIIEVDITDPAAQDAAVSKKASEMVFAPDREGARRGAIARTAREIATAILPMLER